EVPLGLQTEQMLDVKGDFLASSYTHDCLLERVYLSRTSQRPKLSRIFLLSKQFGERLHQFGLMLVKVATHHDFLGLGQWHVEQGADQPDAVHRGDAFFLGLLVHLGWVHVGMKTYQEIGPAHRFAPFFAGLGFPIFLRWTFTPS